MKKLNKKLKENINLTV